MEFKLEVHTRWYDEMNEEEGITKKTIIKDSVDEMAKYIDNIEWFSGNSAFADSPDIQSLYIDGIRVPKNLVLDLNHMYYIGYAPLKSGMTTTKEVLEEAVMLTLTIYGE